MFDLEKFKTGNFYVHLPTQELYDEVMDFLDNNEFRWQSGNYMKYNNNWVSYEHDTGVSFNSRDEGVTTGSLGYFHDCTKKQELPIRKTKLKIADDELEKLHSHVEVNAQLGLVRTLPMGKRSNEERYTELMLENKEIYLDKNKKYGDAFAETIQKYGYISAITRMNDKFNRIEQFTIEGFEDEEESLRDSLMDLANYCYMYVMELDNE